MVILFASSAVNRVFELRSGYNKDYAISICCFFVAKRTALRKRTKTRIMCPSEATGLSADCCFSELALCKSTQECWYSTKRTSSSSH